MIRILRPTIVVLLLFSSAAVVGQEMRWSAKNQTYVDQYRDLAIEQMLKYKIPASITLAQGILESGAGDSQLARRGNNHFGIKCHGWQGATVFFDDDASQECFRAYRDVGESYEDHSKFLVRNKRYSPLFALDHTDYKGWARGLKQCGYATNPNYANKLIGLIELYKLYEYDQAKGYDKFMAANAGHHQQDALLHPIHIYNKNYFLQARRGDTYKSIGKEIGISGKKIAAYNERDYDDQLQENEIVWLKKKQKKADKAYEGRRHRVKAGESMYSIAQYYGIRLKSLYKMNHLKPDYQLRIGDELKVR